MEMLYIKLDVGKTSFARKNILAGSHGNAFPESRERNYSCYVRYAKFSLTPAGHVRYLS